MSRLKPAVSAADHIQGSPDSTLILVEYGDFQCPHCGAAFPIVKQLEKEFAGKMALVFRHFPLSEAHPYAQAAAVASEAAANQGKFWEMHGLIFTNQQSLGVEMLLGLAEKLKLDMKKFSLDFKDPRLFEKVEQDFESGIISGVNGTPTFYMNGHKYAGSYDHNSLYDAITKALG